MRGVIRRSTALIALGMTWLGPAPAEAQNLRDVPLGGKTATMGGAAVAAGRDAALPYLNPAGIAGSPHDVFSISATLYGYGQSSVRDYYVPNRFNPSLGTDFAISEERLEVEWLAITPSTAAYFYRVESERALHVLGLGITTGSYNVMAVDGSFRAASSTATLQEDDFSKIEFIQYLAGPTYAVELGSLRLGVSALGTFGRLVRDDHRLVLVSDRSGGVEAPQTLADRQMIDAYSFGLTLVAGAQVRLGSGVSLGAAVELPGIPIAGGGSVIQARDSSLVDPGTGLQNAQRQVARGQFSEFSISRPARLSAGLAYEAPGRFGLAGDVHFNPPNDEFYTFTADATVTAVQTGFPVAVQSQTISGGAGSAATVNGSLGAELWLSDELVARAGFFTDRDISPDENDAGEPNSRIDWYGAVIGLGSLDGDLETTYGIAYRNGQGRAVSDDLYGNNVRIGVPYVAHGVMLILSGAVRTSNDQGSKSGSPAAAPGQLHEASD